MKHSTTNNFIDFIINNFEGGYTLHQNPTEPQKTYAGIYRKAHPSWTGWKYIDKGQHPPKPLVYLFYQSNFVTPFATIKNEQQRLCVIDFAINAGKKKATLLMQKIAEVKQDGIVGPQTLKAMAAIKSERFLDVYSLQRIDFYNLLAKNKQYRLYLRGWINRTLMLREFLQS